MTPAEFWSWFAQHAARMHSLDGESLVEELYDQLTEVDERLGVEVRDAPDDDGNRDLIITAYALREAIPVALELAAAAPAIPGWKIIGLRPGMGFGFSFRNDDGGFSGKDLRFVPGPAGGAIRIKLLIPAPIDGMPPGQREQLGWQIVNAGLGERLAAAIDELEVVSGEGVGSPIDELAEWLRRD